MRESCLNCARKHIAQAEVLATESVFGYPEYKWLAIAHMAEAEAELQEKYLDLAYEIREHRKVYETDDSYHVPTIALIKKMTEYDEKETVSGA